MEKPLVTEEQALKVASAILSKEKVLDDFGSAVIKESKKIFDDMLQGKEMEKDIKPKILKPATILDLEKK